MAIKSKQKQDSQTEEVSTSGKGRATRTRKEAEASKRRPLIPEDRKAAKQESKRLQREKEREYYAKQREAMRTGDERYLPVRDKGKVRRFMRDYVDSRYKLSEFILFSMLLCLILMLGFSLFPVSAAVTNLVISIVTYLFYGLLILAVLESIVTWRQVKRKALEKWSDADFGRSAWFYLFSRMLTFRKMRSPAPQVKRGEYPDKPHRKKPDA